MLVCHVSVGAVGQGGGGCTGGGRRGCAEEMGYQACGNMEAVNG